jgi:membrane protease YdiL (CAAX protease family)
MVFSLNFISSLMAFSTGTAQPAELSEVELATRYPSVAVTATVLLVVGLVCDLYLLFFLRKRLQSSIRAEPFFQVETKPWTVHDLLLATSVLIFAFAMSNGLLMLGLKLAHIDAATTACWILAMNMFLYAASLLGFVGFFRQRRIDWRQAFGFRNGSRFGAAAFGGLLFFAALPPLAGVFAIYQTLCRLAGVANTPQPIVEQFITANSAVVVGLISVFAIAVAPVFEEFFFRGFAYPALKQRWGTWKALAIVSAAFALVHLHPPSLGPLFALALGLGVAYELTGSLLTPITMHALFNATNVAMLLYVRAHS